MVMHESMNCIGAGLDQSRHLLTELLQSSQLTHAADSRPLGDGAQPSYELREHLGDVLVLLERLRQGARGVH